MKDSSTLNTPDNFLGLPPELCDPQTAKFTIIPAPYEATVSYGAGAALGPRAIIDASKQVELFNGICEPATAGIATRTALPLADVGAEDMIRMIAAEVNHALQSNQIPIVLGGEHTVTLGAVDAVAKKYGNDFGVVQIDAHADLRDQYEETPYSHACVMRRILDKNIPLLQLGVRSLCREEHELREYRNIPHFDARTLAEHGVPQQIFPDDFPENVYFTIDVDGLDPAVIPGTGTPEPGGLDWYTTIKIIERICEARNVVGFDVVELAPIPGTHVSEFATAKLTYSVIGEILKSHNRNCFK